MSERVFHEDGIWLADIFPQVLENAPIGVALTTLELKLVKANRAFCDMLDYSPEELAGKKVLDLTAPHDQEMTLAVRNLLLEDKNKSISVEKTYLKKGGEPLRVVLTVHTFPFEKPFAFLAFVQNINEHYLAEQERQNQEQLTKQLAENIQEVFWVSTPKLDQILYVSPAYEKIWRLSCQSLRDNPRSFLERIHPDDRKKVSQTVLHLPAREGRFEHEYRLVHEDGSITWIYDRGFPIFDRDGKLIRVCGIAEDISKRKRAEEQIAKLNLDLQERILELAEANRKLAHLTEKAIAASRLKTEFVANISHELRTPLSAAIGMSELLLHTNLDDEQRQLVKTISDSSTLLLSIINNILDFSKMDADKIEIENVEFAPLPLIKACLDLLSSRAKAKNLSLHLDFDQSLPTLLKGDPVRLKQVLLNLADNALKFTHDGQITVKVRLEQEQDGNARMAFAVTDTGIGLSEAECRRIFEPFVQANGSTTREYGGTGLGLTISQRLVELMGGTLSVESNKGQGSTFRFSLPFTP